MFCFRTNCVVLTESKESSLYSIVYILSHIRLLMFPFVILGCLLCIILVYPFCYSKHFPRSFPQLSSMSIRWFILRHGLLCSAHLVLDNYCCCRFSVYVYLYVSTKLFNVVSYFGCCCFLLLMLCDFMLISLADLYYVIFFVVVVALVALISAQLELNQEPSWFCLQFLDDNINRASTYWNADNMKTISREYSKTFFCVDSYHYLSCAKMNEIFRPCV